MNIQSIELSLLSGATIQLTGEKEVPPYASIKYDAQSTSADDILLSVTIAPFQPLSLKALRIKIPVDYQDTQYIFCNGFQSWSESRMYNSDSKIDKLRPIARPLMGYYGDDHFDFIPAKKGVLHSWSYSYVQYSSSEHLFIGSLDEASGFSCLIHHTRASHLEIVKDLEGMMLDQPLTCRFWWGKKADIRQSHEHWFSLMNIPVPRAKPATGWTSWYNHYTDISEDIILNQARTFSRHKQTIDFFQIDDGYQSRIGDWLEVKPAFPRGMHHVAQTIHQLGYTPGLWIAPFIAEHKSSLFKNHKDWLLKDERGKLLRAGYNPMWSGWYYALDIYHPECRAYLENVFKTIIQRWGFRLLKLDFLFAVCIRPAAGKSRGQIMHDAMCWLKEMSGEAMLLACGAPLASTFGLADYCRTGADIHLRWEHRLLKYLRHRERVSTLIALRTTLSRWALSGLAFWNDPDVFLLRNHNIYLNEHQKETILLVNQLAGHLLFTSDDIGLYDDIQREKYNGIFAYADTQVMNIELLFPDVYAIQLEHQQTAVINLSSRRVYISAYDIHLEAFQSKILHYGNNKLLSP
jgi:alpha-galactosidase